MLRCWRNLRGQMHHFPALPWVPGELLGWFLSPGSQPLHGTIGNLQGIAVFHLALLQLLRAFISPSADSPLAVFCLPPRLFSFYYPFFLSFLFQLSQYFFVTGKNTRLPMGCKKGLANIHLLLLFPMHKNLFCHAGIM